MIAEPTIDEIEEWRTAMAYTKAKAASLIGVKPFTYSQWVSGKSRPRRGLHLRIRNLLAGARKPVTRDTLMHTQSIITAFLRTPGRKVTSDELITLVRSVTSELRKP